MQVQALVALAVSATVAGIGTPSNVPDAGIWWMNFAEKFGITAALLLYFVYRDYQSSKVRDHEREEMIGKINQLETRQYESNNLYLTQFNETLLESQRIHKVVVRTLNRHFDIGDEG